MEGEFRQTPVAPTKRSVPKVTKGAELEQTRQYIAAIDTTGSPTLWNPNAGGFVYALAVSGSAVYVGGAFTTIGGLTRNRIAAFGEASGQATSWNPNAGGFVYALAIADSTVYVSGNFISIGGQTRNSLAALDAASGLATNWNPSANNGVNALAISFNNAKIYVGGIFSSIIGQSRTGFAGIDNPFDPPMSVDNDDVGHVPQEFALMQNYPNPFNPTTKINFQIPHSSFVILKVFDILGKEVATLVNEELHPGNHETTFDGNGLASGVYFYRIQAGDFVQTRKLVLLR